MKYKIIISLVLLAVIAEAASTTNLPTSSTSLQDSASAAETGVFGGKEIPPATQEEKQFLNAVSEAFGKRDSAAAFALICWDNVPNVEERKKDWKWTTGYPSFQYNKNLCNIKYVALEKFNFMQPTEKSDWTYNIPVTKCIYIEYCPTNAGSHGLEDFQGQYLGVGERNGKLMIPIAVKKL